MNAYTALSRLKHGFDSRQVRDSNLETRTARSRLKTRHKPYFRLIEPGLHIGYRKLSSGPGTWVVRRYQGRGAYAVENLRTPNGQLVIADDYAEPDGAAVLSFAQAQNTARAKQARPERSTGSYTVGDAMDDYLRFLASDGRSQYAIYDAQRRDQALIRPKLGDVKLLALTADRLRRWRDELASTPPRLRTRKGEKQKHREPLGTDDAQRARRASTNRTWTVLRAALNHAFRDGNAESDLAWRKVTPFRKVDGARIRYLTLAEAKRLIYACDAEFRPLVQAALQTGARYGELGKLTVADFNPDVGTVTIRQSKSGKARHIVLTDEGRTFFRQLTTGRAGSEMMFEKQWGMSHQLRPMAEAVQRAKITPSISFHGLRHTWASHAVMNGVPLMIVAKNLGHSDSRMVEKHYGHLEPSFIADAIRAGAPRFGTVASGPIVPLHSRRK
jgi:integrase